MRDWVTARPAGSPHLGYRLKIPVTSRKLSIESYATEGPVVEWHVADRRATVGSYVLAKSYFENKSSRRAECC